MKRLIITIVCSIAALLLCIMVINKSQSGTDAVSAIQNFHHWTVQAHWTNPETRTVRVLLDEDAVDATDYACDQVLQMLDELTRIVPSWSIEMISPTGWVPSSLNPIDRAGVEYMIRYATYKGMEADQRWEDKYPEGSLTIDQLYTRDNVESLGPPSIQLIRAVLESEN